jgi:uncharacterized protein (TIGR04551 family)
MRVFRLGWFFTGSLSLLLSSQLLGEDGKSPSTPNADNQPSNGISEKSKSTSQMESNVGILPPPTSDKNQAEALPPPPPGFTEVKMDQGGAAKPPLNLLDLHGYLRLRGDLNKSVDLGTPVREPYPQFPHPATGKGDTLAGANMRFRLEPTLNISEDVRIMGQIDILDNLVLGSTPNEFKNQDSVFLSQSQSSPSTSIAVKRLWGEAKLPFGLLRFGRMGSQWGLGIMANDGGPAFVDRGPLVTSTNRFDPMGQCYDCDYGSTVDRIMFITKIFGHYIVPMLDFTSEGPTYANFNEYGGQGIDLDQLDDVHSYILSIFKRDKPEDIRQALDQDSWVLNYGLYFTYRQQSYDALTYETTGTLATGMTNYSFRSANMFIPDIWVRFMWRKLRIELEAVLVTGRIRVTTDDTGKLESDSVGGVNKRLDMLQFGGVLQADYRLLNDQLLLGFETGIASGDDQLTFGSGPFLGRLKRARIDSEDPNYNVNDPYGYATTSYADAKKQSIKHINNFIFNRDYHVDLILWRQIVGSVTNAYYLKPSVQYTFPLGIGAKLSAIYSSSLADNTRGKRQPLGMEFDVDVFYFSSDHFHAGVSYGLLIPFNGMNDLGNDFASGGVLAADKDKSASIAHRVMGRLVLYF